MNSAFGAEAMRDKVILIARLLLAALFVVFGWGKLIGFGGTVAEFGQAGLAFPTLAAVISVVMELGVGVAIAVGVFTRPLAVLLAVYTLATALIGHRFWTMTGAAQVEAEINFFKNVSIMGGLFLLYATGPGRFSLDRRLGFGG